MSDAQGGRPGKRLGFLLAAEPELTKVREDEAGQEMATRFVAYITADGFDAGRMITRMEQLKFETIVRQETYREVLADLERKP